MNILELSAILSLLGTPVQTGMPPPSLYQPVALTVACQVTKAPIINIRPVTKDIQYDFRKTSAELSQLQSNTISPYGMNVDQTTGGLRHDRPIIKMDATFNITQNAQTGATCMTYNTINVDILLQPKIYIAKEFNYGRCGREVLEHEKKHVHVDRVVMNKYTKLFGQAIQKAVNQAGAIGPFNAERTEEFQQKMFDNVKSALTSYELSMQNEMNREQQKIDSLEEYERVGQHCKKASERVLKNRER